MKILDKLFGNAQNRDIKRMQVIVEQVNKLEPEMRKLSDEQFPEKTAAFKETLQNKKDDEISSKLDLMLPEAFALVREAARRIISERHYDVQLLGGIALHEGKIAEMKTGEGKTLAATLAVYLNALAGRGVHIVTVNDYLSKRDANWMGAVYHFLGLSTACINHDASFLYEPKIIDKEEVSIEMENLQSVPRAQAYQADVLYGTNNEFGFDYLRDNMAQSIEQIVQRPLYYAIVDEVDSILIDEARTPLIISAPDTESTEKYGQFARLVPRLKKKEDYEIDEKLRSVILTQEGISKMEKWLGIGNIYESSKVSYVHHLEQALKANVLFKLDRDYVVKDGNIVIVDEFTGRLMPGRRYSEGLHQAIEAKESVKVQRESRTLASITFQNYFRIYKKLAGMTGTALTSAEEFHKVYELEVSVIPTNQEMVRNNMRDVVYRTEDEKFRAIINEIIEYNKKGRPVLVGTIAIEKSEYLAALLKKSGIEHEVLNAKNHEREANIIVKAGQKGAVTIATNMAGRGTDIKLGEGVENLGGLHILGTERHEARRIDNQLRGRAGRQGDRGSSQFFVSLEDELMRRFGGDRMKNIMKKLGLPKNQPIENKMITKSIESAQNKIEGFNFDIRKRVLEYDDVMNKQRETIYNRRRKALCKKNIKADILNIFLEEIEAIVAAHTVSEDEDQWSMKEISKEVSAMTGEKNDNIHKKLIDIKKDKGFSQSAEKKGAIIEFCIQEAKKQYAEKEKEIGSETMRAIEKAIYLRTTDSFWMDHLEQMEYVREDAGLQGYGQRDPLMIYKKEAFEMFQSLLSKINHTIANAVFRVFSTTAQTSPFAGGGNFSYSGGQQVQQFDSSDQQAPAQQKDSREKSKAKPIINSNDVGRNDPCPCGSGKKYKKCCYLKEQ
ncbi:MAG: preprotein translocase subunit SecA [Patescibacteria group bacterium]|nr:preprotein translocase subunit SecA [Patescibacteria group bacterium]